MWFSVVKRMFSDSIYSIHFPYPESCRYNIDVGAAMLLMCFVGPVVCGAGGCRATNCEYLRHVEVERLNVKMTDDNESNEDVLWRIGTEKFPFNSVVISTKDWQNKWIKCREVLIEKARLAGFDYMSLSKIIDNLRPVVVNGNNVAKIPIAAYVVNKDEEVVWLVVLLWEFEKALDSDGNTYWGDLVHVEVMSFLEKDQSLLSSTKCH